jgi:hypothetical protein
VTEPLYLGAYWEPRRESAGECGKRLADCLARLVACNDLLQRWHEKAYREADAGRSTVDADPEGLRDLLLRGVNRRDADGTPIEELGFSAALWNGVREAPIGLSITCGACTSARGVMNAFVLDLPLRQPGPAAQLYELDTGLAVMRSVVEAWEPDWASLTCDNLAAALDSGPREPSIGWITFLSGRRPFPRHLPIPFQKRVAGRGMLLIAADRAEDVEVSSLREVSAVLSEAGTLEPTPDRSG